MSRRWIILTLAGAGPLALVGWVKWRFRPARMNANADKLLADAEAKMRALDDAALVALFATPPLGQSRASRRVRGLVDERRFADAGRRVARAVADSWSTTTSCRSTAPSISAPRSRCSPSGTLRERARDRVGDGGVAGGRARRFGRAEPAQPARLIGVAYAGDEQVHRLVGFVDLLRQRDALDGIAADVDDERPALPSFTSSAVATTSRATPRSPSSSTARLARSWSAHTSTARALFFAFFAGALAALGARLTSFFGATATKLSSMTRAARRRGTCFALANFSVTQPCLPMP